jgi:hypothetical protein
MDRLGEEFARELGRFGNAGVMADLVAAWPEAVGETVATNAWPARLARDGTLHVSTASSTWAFELQQLEHEIAERMRSALGSSAPARLRFAPGPLPERLPASSPEARKPPPQPSPEESQKARELAAAIGPEELRKSVEKAARMSLARAAADRSVW